MSPARGRATLLAALMAVLALAGCGTTVTGSGQAVGSSGAPSSADFPSDTTPDPVPSTTVTSAPSPSPTSSAGSDITDVKYTVPKGFALNSTFREAIPLETTFQAKFFTPTGATGGLDVITVLLYRLPGPHLVDTRAQQVARILSYNSKLRVTVTRKLQDAVLAGRPAFAESVVQPGPFRYATWFIFGGEHLVQISCQVDTRGTAVAAGCGSLLVSLVLS